MTGQTKKRPAEECDAELRQTRMALDACQTNARAAERKMQAVMEATMAGWRGDDATAWLRQMDTIYQSMAAKFARQARQLHGREDELMAERRAAQDEPDDETHDSDGHDDERRQ